MSIESKVVWLQDKHEDTIDCILHCRRVFVHHIYFRYLFAPLFVQQDSQVDHRPNEKPLTIGNY